MNQDLSHGRKYSRAIGHNCCTDMKDPMDRINSLGHKGPTDRKDLMDRINSL